MGNFTDSISEVSDIKAIFEPYGLVVDLINVKDYGELIALTRKICEA